MTDTKDTGLQSLKIQTITTSELLESIKRQMEFYFSNENLANDTYLNGQMDSNKSVAISVVMKFAKMKQLTTDENMVIQALKDSNVCVVENGRIRGLLKAAMKSTLILRDIPSDAHEEKVKELFKFPGCAPIVGIRSDIGDTWFILFDGEDDAKNALSEMKAKKVCFQGKPIKGRVKTETTTPRSFAPQYSATAVVPPLVSPSHSNAYVNVPSTQPGMPMYAPMPYEYPPPGAPGMPPPMQMTYATFPPPIPSYPGAFPDVNMSMGTAMINPNMGNNGGIYYRSNTNTNLPTPTNPTSNGVSNVAVSSNVRNGNNNDNTKDNIKKNNNNMGGKVEANENIDMGAASSTQDSNPVGGNKNNGDNKGANQKATNQKAVNRSHSSFVSMSQTQSQQPAAAASQEKPTVEAATKPAPGSWAEKLLSGNMEAPIIPQKKKVTAPIGTTENADKMNNGKKANGGDNQQKSQGKKNNDNNNNNNGGDKRGKDGNNKGSSKSSSAASTKPSKKEEVKMRDDDNNDGDDSEISVAPPTNWGGKPTFLQIMKEKAVGHPAK